MRVLTRTLPLVALLLVPILTACEVRPAGPVAVTPRASRTPYPTAEPKLNSVTYIVGANGLLGADGAPEALTEITLQNDAQELLQLQFVKLTGAQTFDSLLQALQADPTRLPDWAQPAGGPDAVAPGRSASAIIDVTAGTYAVFARAPLRETLGQVPRAMIKQLSVEAPLAGKLQEPGGAFVVAAADGKFTLSAPVAAGAQLVRVDNVGTQAHEVMVFALTPGKTASDLLAALKSGAALPGTPAGGIAALAPGTHGFFRAEFAPGTYALVCPIHGEAIEVTVQ